MFSLQNSHSVDWLLFGSLLNHKQAAAQIPFLIFLGLLWQFLLLVLINWTSFCASSVFLKQIDFLNHFGLFFSSATWSWNTFVDGTVRFSFLDLSLMLVSVSAHGLLINCPHTSQLRLWSHSILPASPLLPGQEQIHTMHHILLQVLVAWILFWLLYLFEKRSITASLVYWNAHTLRSSEQQVLLPFRHLSQWLLLRHLFCWASCLIAFNWCPVLGSGLIP